MIDTTNSSIAKIEEKIQEIWNVIQTNHQNSTVNHTFLMVSFSSIKELSESYILLMNSGYEVGAGVLIRPMYESLLYIEALNDVNENDKNTLQQFFTSKPLTDYFDKYGKRITFSKLHRLLTSRFESNDKKIKKNLDDLYKYLNKYSHLSLMHIRSHTNDAEQKIYLAVPPPNNGIKLPPSFNNTSVVLFILTVYYEIFKTFFEKKNI